MRPDLDEMARRIDAAVAAGQDPYTALVDAAKEGPCGCDLPATVMLEGRVRVCSRCGHSWSPHRPMCVAPVAVAGDNPVVCGVPLRWWHTDSGGWWVHTTPPPYRTDVCVWHPLSMEAQARGEHHGVPECTRPGCFRPEGHEAVQHSGS